MHASRAMMPEHTVNFSFLCAISDSLGIYSAGFLAEVSDDDDNAGINVDEQQQQQHSGPAT